MSIRLFDIGKTEASSPKYSTRVIGFGRTIPNEVFAPSRRLQ